MDRVFVIRAAGLYLPIAAAVLLWLLRKPSLAERAGLLLASAWNASALLVLNMLAVHLGLWHYEAKGGMFFGVPVDLYLGWVVLWGVCPHLAFRTEPIWVATAFFAALDFLMMPRLQPVLRLGSQWWLGELIALSVCLIPSLILARLTARRQNVRLRAILQFFTFSSLTMWLLPSIILATLGRHWPTISHSWLFAGLQAVATVGMPGVAAVYEFAMRGKGTPLPYDPPQRLVTSGPYAYIANPMQMAAASVLLVWGAELRCVWIALAGVMAHIYSMGLATWDEREDMLSRFGDPWLQYRMRVRNFIPRWKPYVPESSTLYVSATCEVCSEVKGWFERRNATGLNVEAAETYPGRLTRITYVHADGWSEHGVAAVARAVEHINLGWAYLGWGARLPVINQALQLLVDANGGEPRAITCNAATDAR